MRLPMPTPRPAELPCMGRAWMAQVRKGLDDEDKVLFVNVVANAKPPQPAELPCLERT